MYGDSNRVCSLPFEIKTPIHSGLEELRVWQLTQYVHNTYQLALCNLYAVSHSKVQQIFSTKSQAKKYVLGLSVLGKLLFTHIKSKILTSCKGQAALYVLLDMSRVMPKAKSSWGDSENFLRSSMNWTIRERIEGVQKHSAVVSNLSNNTDDFSFFFNLTTQILVCLFPVSQHGRPQRDHSPYEARPGP